jgi:NADPH2:quinone reductase
MDRAIVVARQGGPEVLELREQPIGAPGRGQVRVRVAAAGVNFIDTYQRSGAYPRPLPFVPGLEGAGVVEAIGEGVQGLAVGDRVGWVQAAGSYATGLLAASSALIRIPEGVATDLAAASLLQGMTAHYLVYGVRQTQAGDVALVHAAAGGTGLLLVQMLKQAGARVLGTCSSEAKARLAREAGADEIVRYDEVDFAAEVKRLTSGRGVDVAYDSVGRTTFDGSLKSLRARGLCVLFGQASGAVPPFDLQRLNQGGSLFITRPSLAHYMATREEFELRAGVVLTAVATGKLRVRIDRRFELAQAADAHRVLEARGSTGKLLLVLEDSTGA